MSFNTFLIGWLAFHLFFAALTAFAASRWGRDPFAWLLIGTVLGPIGFVVLLGIRRDDLRRSRPSLAGPGSRAEPRGRRRLLVPVDGSPSSERAVQHVIENVDAKGVETTLLAVLPIEMADGVQAAEGSLRRQQLEEEIKRHMGSAPALLRDAGIPCQPVTRFGDPADEILALAQEGGYELIVMGRRGRGAVAKLLLGSVSDKVVKSASCPVTVVS